MHAALRRSSLSLALFLAACSQPGQAPESSPAGSAPQPVAADSHAAGAPSQDAQACTHEPHHGEDAKRPRCGGLAVAPAAPQAYRAVGGSGDPVDQVVCDLHAPFVLDGKLFGVEFSGGVDGTYRFVRTPDIPGLHWSAGGRYHIDFPDGADRPGMLTTEGGGTTTAGATTRATSGGERFVLTPVPACQASRPARR